LSNWTTILSKAKLLYKQREKGRLIYDGKRPVSPGTVFFENRDIFNPRITRGGIAPSGKLARGSRYDDWDFDLDTLESRCTIWGVHSSLPTRKGHAILLLLLAKIANGPRDDYWASCVELFKESNVPFEKVKKAVNLAVLSNPFRVFEYDLFLKEMAYDMLDHPMFANSWRIFHEQSMQYILDKLLVKWYPLPPAVAAIFDRKRDTAEIRKELIAAGYGGYLDEMEKIAAAYGGFIKGSEAIKIMGDTFFTQYRKDLVSAIMTGAGKPASSFNQLLVNLQESLMASQYGLVSVFTFMGMTSMTFGAKNVVADEFIRQYKLKHATEGWGKGWHRDRLGHRNARLKGVA